MKQIPALAAIALLAPALGLAASTFDDVAPIFAARCVMCHAGDGAPLGLRLDSHAGVLKGSQKGPVVKAGAPAASELLRRVRGQSQPRMPLVGDPLGADDIARIERWIADGAAPGKKEAAAAAPARPKPGEPVTWAHAGPILLQRCAKCHADNGIMGAPPEGYRLSSYENALAASDRVRIVPGNPGASEVVRRIRGQSQPRMPFDGPPWLNDDDVRLIEEWIRQGARGSDGRPAPVPAGARVRFEGTLT
ncbi:MAG TPA: c-type cytochrome domain-containing protein, partial [Burkholderiales bacterium]|nr:c-type cytochrome domain-containing protein [Burkholderiales bacterium]